MIFVIQKHRATHLHYDFRIEKDGVLKSWAIPKEPPQEAGIKRLAVQVEDHALGYENFEGRILEGYGAGTVEIWDKGAYRPIKYETNEIIVDLKGKKMKGQYCLIKLKPKLKTDKNWLFFKKNQLHFDVVGALIEDKGRYLVCQRLEHDRFGSMWEFPGGKVEEGESKKAALKREIKEELGLEIGITRLVSTFEDEISSMKITVYLYLCSIIRGEPQCIECQDLRWLDIEEIKKLNLAPADTKILAWLDKR